VNALFFTQGRSLLMFHALSRALTERHGGGRRGFYIADRQFHREFIARHPDADLGEQVTEWEVVARARHGRPDVGRLGRYERALGVTSFTPAIVADRRLTHGRASSIRLDSRPPFDREQSLHIVECGLDALTGLFDRVRPDVVYSFICVTFGEYLGYLIARARGIPFLNIRPTRIENFVTMAPDIFEPSAFVRAAWADRAATAPGAQRSRDEARRCLERIRLGSGKYEGVVPASRRPPPAPPPAVGMTRRVLRQVGVQWQHTFGDLRGDFHQPAPASVFVHRRIVIPARARYVQARLRQRLIARDRLGEVDYVFFPLHTEPEVSLLVQAPEFLNQIEVVRNLSRALPSGWRLLVKEHPAAVGRRSLRYYQQLMEIPGVRLVDPAIESAALVSGSRLVATIAGSVGLEAAVRGRPVVTFGNTPYELLPDTMVRRARDLSRLGDLMHDLCATYRMDEDSLERYFAATIDMSDRINLYSTLLGRQGVHVPGDTVPTFDEDVTRLAALGDRLLAGPARAVAGLRED
jgi:hypothetical protein